MIWHCMLLCCYLHFMLLCMHVCQLDSLYFPLLVGFKYALAATVGFKPFNPLTH
jgi:hypothetical protein